MPTLHARSPDDRWPDAVPPEDRVPEVHVVTATAGDDVVAVGLLDARGGRADPAVPAVRLVVRGDHAASLAVVRALVDEARRRGVARLTMGWDPMDAPGLKRLAAIGFMPTGEMPYFELGGGEVQHVSGYMDATGSILDLACALDRG